MTFEKKFAEFKKELEKRNASELPTDLAMQVTMTDEDCGGTFYIANVGGNFAVEPYDYVDNTVNIAAAAATLKDLLAGKLDGPDAMFRGLVTVNGRSRPPRRPLPRNRLRRRRPPRRPLLRRRLPRSKSKRRSRLPRRLLLRRRPLKRKLLLRRKLLRRKSKLPRLLRRKLLLRKLPRRRLRPRLPLRNRLPKRLLPRNKTVTTRTSLRGPFFL